MNISKTTVFLAFMTSFSLLLYFVELMLPKPMPFMKLGLSNIIIVVMVMSSFYREAILVAILKSLIGGFLSGIIFSPTILLSFSGSIMSCLIMIFFCKYVKSLSVSGISVSGAFFHLMTQLVVVRILIIKTDQVFKLYPFLVLCAVLTGLITGILSKLFMKHIDLKRLI